MVSNPPTAKQLAYLRTLAERTGRTFARPCTSRQASAEIRKLRAAQSDSPVERMTERREIADASAARSPMRSPPVRSTAPESAKTR